MSDEDFSSSPNADAFAAPDSPCAIFLSALQSPTPSKDVTVELLNETTDTTIFHLLPLLLSTLQFIGECSDDRDAFYKLVSTFRKRVLRNRVLKLRFLLHASHPSFNAYWRFNEERVEEDEERDIYSEIVEEVDENNDDIDGMGIEIMQYDEDDPDAEVQEDENIDNDEEEVERLIDKKNVKQVIFTIPMDKIDQGSKLFWEAQVYETENVDNGHVYPVTSLITNPFYRDFENIAEKSSDGQMIVVRKVFSSIARPKIVNVCRDEEGTDVVDPGIMVKSGDNLMQDLGVITMFQLFNKIWASDKGFEAKPKPVAIWYDILPATMETGLMQAVNNLTSLKEFNWEEWRSQSVGDEERVNDMIRSVAGSYIATYIIGGRDRHFDNILIKDNYQILHIDFTYIIGKKPALDAPPISFASEMQDAFEKLQVWDSFVDLCVDAYLSIRKYASDVLRISKLAFARSGVEDNQLDSFLRSKSSLYLAVEDDKAAKFVRNQVKTGATSAQTWIKRIAHDVIDPAWYDLLKKGFPPAVAVMNMLDASENAEANKLAEQLKEQGDSVLESDKVEVSDDDEE